MHQRSNISFVLEQAILNAIQNPPQPTSTSDIKIRESVEKLPDIDLEAPNEQPFDFLAYHDSMNVICDLFEILEGKIVSLGKDEFLTQKNIDTTTDNIYHFNQNHLIDAPGVDDEWLVVNHEQIVITHAVAANDIHKVGRLMGVNNLTFNNSRLYKDKASVLIQPFEMTTLVKPASIKGITPYEAFEQNPLHSCFMHLLSPAPVMGIALEQRLAQLIGYVVHVKILYNLLDNANMIESSDNMFSLKNHIALQFDSQSALKMLSYRYRIDVDQNVIKRITEFDEQIKKHSKSVCCIEVT